MRILSISKPSLLPIPYRFPDGTYVEAKITKVAFRFLQSLRNHPNALQKQTIEIEWSIPNNPLETSKKEKPSYKGFLPAIGFLPKP